MTRVRPFSLRHAKALQESRIQIELTDSVRRRLWSTLRDQNKAVYYSEPDNPNWTINSTVLEQTEVTFGRLLGNDQYGKDGHRIAKNLQWLISMDAAEQVFNVLEIFYLETPPESRPDLQRAINESFIDFACPWRLADGMLFRVDSEFLEQEVLERASDLLGVPELEGAQAEFKTARDHLTGGASRDAIAYAAHSVESTLKAILGQGSGSAGDLLRQFAETDFMDDVPLPKARAVSKALMAAAILRNELGGHGQGASIVHPPRPYAELAVHLAASINLFLVAQHLRKSPPAPAALPPQLTSQLDDDIPF